MKISILFLIAFTSVQTLPVDDDSASLNDFTAENERRCNCKNNEKCKRKCKGKEKCRKDKNCQENVNQGTQNGGQETENNQPENTPLESFSKGHSIWSTILKLNLPIAALLML